MATVTLVHAASSSRPTLSTWISCLNELPKIRSTYRSYQDELSLKLITWINETLDVANAYKDTSEAIDQIAQERIAVLNKEVLLNPLTGAPYTKPMLDRDIYVWEEADLKLYRENFGTFSPNDGAKIQSTDHHFAQAMMNWRSTVPINPIPSLDLDVMVTQVKMMMFGQMIENAKSCKLLGMMTAKVHQLSIQCDTATSAVRQELQQEVARVEAREAVRVEATEKRIARTEEVHQSQRAILSGEISKLQQELEPALQELRQEQTKNNQNEAKIQELERTIRDLQQQIASLFEQLNEDSSSCQIL